MNGRSIVGTCRWAALIGALAVAGVAGAQYPQVLKLVKTTVIPDSNIVFSVALKAPAGDAEWAAVQKSAANLVAGARQLLPLGPDSGREAWVEFAEGLRIASQRAADAAAARNAAAVVAAGDAMFAQCEGCHRIYMAK